MITMEGEVSNFVMVWMSVVASLCYCHTIGNIVKQGTTTRFVLLLPVIFLFLFLPLNLTSAYLCGATAFFVAWLAVFKLLLFAFGTGPLSSNPVPLSLSSFILLACFPIKIQHHPSFQIAKKSSLNFAIKSIVVATYMPVFERKPFIHPKLFVVIYSVYIYLGLEIILAAMAALARAFLGVDLEPQFDAPYKSTSLQNFWGRRWNIMVSGILRPTIYYPVRSIFSRLIGRKRAFFPAVIVTFIVSGLMHHLIFYYMGRIKPTWELTCFFLLHGVGVAVEIGIKKKLNGKWRLPVAVSVVLTLSSVMVTASWLFLPSLLKCEADIKARRETLAFFEFLKSLSGRIFGFLNKEIVELLSWSSDS